ncbi:hypothetical protein HK099_003989 [Clydaea vesicula]|uniref:Protein farnesyltransferase subunit beta n=1 Tax=Clydaea vesicula TaxID=447962 RepID=A0AAD5U135_9FUNG|nr:hypothetical protein HK099_003989 [Clydaea vesicula]
MNNSLSEDNEISSYTLELQSETEEYIKNYLKIDQKFFRKNHIGFLKKVVAHLPLSSGFISLDASKPWILYWTVHALDLLSYPLSKELQNRIISTLKNIQNPITGGFGGGPGQISHLATSYAAVNCLAIIGTTEAFEIIDREKMYKWILSLKLSNGSFMMAQDMEVDVRGSYCAVNIAKLLGILTDPLCEKVAAFICECQTYEGGIGAVPNVEAHGGYTFCALAAMEILKATETLKLNDLLFWAVSRQMTLEGGFQGRTNKLVDGCYSFWQGGLFPILSNYFENNDLYSKDFLQRYIFNCCQNSKGGLLDKPSKPPDFYHSCYVLSGLSTSQHEYNKDLEGNYAVSTIEEVENDWVDDNSSETSPKDNTDTFSTTVVNDYDSSLVIITLYSEM